MDSSLKQLSLAPNLAGLPAEVLVDICRQLCLHCQVEHVVDASREAIQTSREGQSALAALSGTCKTLRNVAQPVLFHMYHNGQMGSIPKHGAWDDTNVSSKTSLLL
jgi:hypothetical protein